MAVVEVLHHYLLFPQLYFIVRKLYSRKVPGATILLFKSLGFQINIRIPICSSVLQAFLTSGFSCFFSSNRVAGKGIFFSSQQRFFQNCLMLIVWVLRTSSRKMKLVVKSWMLLHWVTRLRNLHQISLSLLQDILLCYSNPEWQIFIFSTGGLGHPDLAVNWTSVLWTSIS